MLRVLRDECDDLVSSCLEVNKAVENQEKQVLAAQVDRFSVASLHELPDTICHPTPDRRATRRHGATRACSHCCQHVGPMLDIVTRDATVPGVRLLLPAGHWS